MWLLSVQKVSYSSLHFENNFEKSQIEHCPNTSGTFCKQLFRMVSLGMLAEITLLLLGLHINNLTNEFESCRDNILARLETTSWLCSWLSSDVFLFFLMHRLFNMSKRVSDTSVLIYLCVCVRNEDILEKEGWPVHGNVIQSFSTHPL